MSHQSDCSLLDFQVVLVHVRHKTIFCGFCYSALTTGQLIKQIDISKFMWSALCENKWKHFYLMTFCRKYVFLPKFYWLCKNMRHKKGSKLSWLKEQKVILVYCQVNKFIHLCDGGVSVQWGSTWRSLNMSRGLELGPCTGNRPGPCIVGAPNSVDTQTDSHDWKHYLRHSVGGL